jgi:predicted nucleic acid-binding protein
MRALDRDRVRRKYRITLEDVDRVGRLLDQTAERTPISVEVVGVATHPEDDVILATAVSADVDYLVTGDVQLQRLRAYRGVGG